MGILGDKALSHYLANMGHEVPEIKMPWVRPEIDTKCYTFLEILKTGEKIGGGGFC